LNPARATHVPHAGMPKGQPRSITDNSAPVIRTMFAQVSRKAGATELPRWSCQPRGRTERKPRTLGGIQTTRKPAPTRKAAVG
jgi:hypothetical protein